MAIEPVPSITPLYSPVPDRQTQQGNELSNNMDGFSFSIGPWGDSIKLIGDNVENNATEAESFATASSGYADDSATSASESLSYRNEAQIAANTAISTVGALPETTTETNDNFDDITTTWNKGRIALETNSAPYKPVIDLDFARDTYKSYVGLAAGWQTAPLLDLATFSRVGDATGVNAFGNVETVSTDQPRVVFENGIAKGILLEGDGSNLGAYSEELDQWIGSATATLSAFESPVDSNFWEVSGTAGVQKFLQTPVTDSGQSIAMSIFVLKNMGSVRLDWVSLTGGTTQEYPNTFNTDTGLFTTINASITSTYIEEFNNAYRIGVVATKNNTGNANSRLDVSTSSVTTASAWFVGGQIEESDVVTSYIKTESVAAPRYEDNFALDLSNVNSNGNWAILVKLDTDAEGSYFTFTDDTADNRITFLSNLNNAALTVVADSVDTSIATATPFVLGQESKAMIVRDGGDLHLYLNGSLIASTTISIFDADLLKLGQGVSDATKTNCVAGRTQVYTAFEYDTEFDVLAKSWTGV